SRMMGFLDVFNWRDVASVSCCSDFARQPLQEDEPTKDEGPLELDRSNLVGDRPPFSKNHGVPSPAETGRHDSRARAPGWSFWPHPDRCVRGVTRTRGHPEDIALDVRAGNIYGMRCPDSGIQRQWNATSTRYQGKWRCPFPFTPPLARLNRT